MLHALQDTFGYIDEEAVPLLADTLNISRAEVYGVISFYRTSARPGRPQRGQGLPRRVLPGGRCRAPRRARDGPSRHRARGDDADGSFTLEQVFCLGNCALGPAVMVDGRLVGRVDEARFDALVARPERALMAETTVFVPRDAAARSVGADEVAIEIARVAAERSRGDVRIVRNGSRGLLYLEPLVEVATAGGAGRLRPGRTAGRRRTVRRWVPLGASTRSAMASPRRSST